MNDAKVSIFLPTAARFDQGLLVRAVDSALAQSRANFELLVVDDGSLDGSAGYLASVADADVRVKIIRMERNSGIPAYSLAQAFPHATGEYFAWLFDDCEFDSRHNETLVSALEANPQWGMVYGRALAKLSEESYFEIGRPIELDLMEKGENVIPNVCVLLRRSTVERIGWYDPHVLLKRWCDWDLWLRVAREIEIGFIDEILAIEHGVGLVGSLGRIFHPDRDLSVRYAGTSRNARLRPQDLTLDDAFRRDLGLAMDDTDRENLELAVLEHALFTLDVTRCNEAAERLVEFGAVDGPLARFNIQNGRAVEAADDRRFVAIADLMKRRANLHASAQITQEVATRAALQAADLRGEALEDLRRELDRSIQAMAQRDSDVQELRQQVCALDQELVEEREKAKTEQRLLEDSMRELANMQRSLFVFRDAADRRFEMLHIANEKIQELNGVAEARLNRLSALEAQPSGGDVNTDSLIVVNESAPDQS